MRFILLIFTCLVLNIYNVFSQTEPTISTTTAYSINSTSASSGASISSDGGESVTAKGVCWSTSANPTISDSKSTDGTGTASFSSTITGLLPNTTYHYRAYATNSIGTSYGSDLTFTTSALPSSTEEWNQILKVVASDRASGDNYGYNIAISGDYAVVGSPFNDLDASAANSMSNAGAAYILKQTNGIWSQVQKIVSSDRAASDNFGYRVAIDGNYIVIGAWGEDEDANGSNTLGGAGSAYIFKNSGGTWSQIKKIVASDRRTADNFGISVTISGNYIAVGAHLQDFDVNNANQVNSAGSVYLYYNNSDTWNQVQKLVATDRSWQDYFGISLSMSGDYLAIGARQEGTESYMTSSSPSYLLANNVDKNTCQGAVYMYQNVSSTWTYVQKITAPTRNALDLFGWSVSLSGSTLVIGAPGEDEDMNESNTITDAGAAYVYKNFSDSWRFTQKLVSTDRATNDILGRDVSTDASHIIVGAFQEDEDANNSNSLTDAGSVYIFDEVNSAWIQSKKIVAPDRASQDNFGYRVAISGNSILSTAYLEDEDVSGNTTLSNAGSIYSFSLAPIVSSVSVPSNGTYSTGQSLIFTVNFYGNVTVTGTPRIALTIGSSTVYASYTSGSGTSALVFSYTLQSGDTDSDGITVGEMGLNGGTITSSSTSAVLTLNNIGSTSAINISSGPSTYVSTTSGTWTTAGTWVSNAVPSSSDYAQISNGHTVTISANTSITNLILKSGSTLTITGTAVLTITGYLQDEGGSFSVASGAQVLLMGNIKNASGTNKFVNTSTNGFSIKGNIDVQQ